jgi:hypothetical protein
MYLWVMSKSYRALSGEVLPVAYSYARNHSAMGYEESGWGLVWVSLDAHHLAFLQSGTDPNVEIVGREWDRPTDLLLETYQSKLGGYDFDNLGQVLSKLGLSEPRFLIDRSPDKA